MENSTKKFIKVSVFLLIFVILFVLGKDIVKNGTPGAAMKYEALKPPERGSITGFNLNTATKEALISIKGIGEAYAKSIIEMQDKMGHFKSVCDLEYVGGIGEKRAQFISEYVRID